MILDKLQLNEQQIITFGISVFGTTESPSSIRFVIEGKEFDVICRCKQVGEDLQVSIPPLKGIIEAGEYQTRLEVIIGDKIFTPLKESIEFNPLVEFGVVKKNKRISEGVEIKVSKASSKDTKDTQLDELTKNGYSVNKINGFNILKHGDLYAGFISENKVIKSDVEYSTLIELVDSMNITKSE